MRILGIQIFILLLVGVVSLNSTPAYADGFNMKTVNSLTDDGGVGMSDVEDLFGAPFETVEIPGSEDGCLEGWLYTEVIMDGFELKAAQVLTVYFDEDGYVCSTHITDGDKLDETKEREE